MTHSPYTVHQSGLQTQGLPRHTRILPSLDDKGKGSDLRHVTLWRYSLLIVQMTNPVDAFTPVGAPNAQHIHPSTTEPTRRSNPNIFTEAKNVQRTYLAPYTPVNLQAYSEPLS